jgi:UDP-N-acetylmuramate--alanine ligase
LTVSEQVHFIGIGGYGMSAIARVMLDMGFRVTGSDVASQDLTDKLSAHGAKVYIGHEAQNVTGADLVVYSTALSKDNVEMMEAEKLQIPILHRSQMLARLMNERSGVAVAGAHGKTTTSSMIALVMENSGLDPTFIIGGEIMNVGSNAKTGQGEFLIAEADESDGSFLNYHPKYAIVTNIEADHLENYDGSYDNLKEAYRQFLSHLKEGGVAVVCNDCPDVRELIPIIKGEVITYGIHENADYVASHLQFVNRTSSFDVHHKGQYLGRMTLSIPGKHNVYNALATIITCLKAGLSFEQIAKSLQEFRGAKRRFQVLLEQDDMIVIDDYAHHPTEIQATISAARATGKRIIALFQPQRYTRTHFLLDAFSRAFSEADEVIITNIFSPTGEKRIEGVNSEKLVDLIRKNSHSEARFIATKEEVQEYLLEHMKSGDLVLTMGAGDIWKVAKNIADQLRKE